MSKAWSPFDKARLNSGVHELNEDLAREILDEVEERCIRTGYRDAEGEMEFVLDLHEIWDEDYRHAHKSYIGYMWAARRRERADEQEEAFARIDRSFEEPEEFNEFEEDDILF